MFQNLINFISRLFGGGKKNRDKPLPPALPGSDAMQITTDGKERSTEAERVLKAYIRAPYQIADRPIRIGTVSWDEGRKYFKDYGWNPDHWKANREGTFYAPKPPFQVGGLIQLVDKSLGQDRRIFLTLHEGAGHALWHWVLTDDEWLNWKSQNRTPEDFADDLAKRLLGEKLDKSKTLFFEALEARLRKEGAKSIRG